MARAEVRRRHGVNPATFYKWKPKFGGMDVSHARRLRTLEHENARLKRLLAEAELDKAVLKDLRLRLEPNAPRRLCHDTIYQYVYSASGLTAELMS